MDGRPSPVDLDAAVRSCVDVLSAFGVTRAEVRERWGYTGGDDLEDAVRSVIRRVTESPASVVRETIADTDRCVDAPARYWDTALQIQLQRVFDALGGTVAVVDATGAQVDEGGTDEPFRIAVTDARGETHATTFSYPPTPLGRDNYAAAIRAVENDLLADTGFTFAPIGGPGDRWRFALVDAEKLSALQDRLGDRLRLDGDPVLSAHEASDYVPGGTGVHVPPWAEEYDDGSVADVSAREVFDVEAYIEARDAPAVDEVLEGTEPAEIARTAAESTTATDGGGVVEDFDEFVSNLAEASVPEPTPVAVASADVTPGRVNPEAVATDDDREGLDRAFEQIAREAATETAVDHEATMSSERHEGAVVAMAKGADPDELPQDIFGAKKEDAPEFEWVEDERVTDR